MPKCYSYIRFSRPEQMRGDSLRRQTEAAEKWAAENGMVIDESLADLGVSAYRGLNRLKGALGKFLELVAKGQVPRGSYLIIESLDRFSREDALDVIGEFSKVLKSGITIVTLLDGQVYSRERIKAEPMALFGSLMVMMRAHEESKTKGKRVGEAWEKKRRAASDAVLTSRVPGWLQVVEEGGKRRIDFKRDGREVVRRIFADTIGGYGKLKVAQRLKAAGFETFEGGKTWHESYVQKVLRNRATIGEMQPYKRDEEGRRVPAGPPVKGYYPAAISEADFMRASAALALRDKSGGPREATGEANLLRNLARCTCGGRMKRENKGGKSSAWLVCAEASRGDCANTRRWRLDLAEEKLLGCSARIDFRKLLAAEGEPVEAAPTVADYEAKVAEVGKRLASIMAAVESGVTAYAYRAVELQKEFDEAEAELARVRRLGALGAHQPSPEQRRRTLAELKARLEGATDAERADLRVRLAQEVRAAFKGVTFGPDRIEATYKGLVPYGKVMQPRDVTVLIHTENPDEIADFLSVSLEMDEANRNGGSVAELGRRLQARWKRMERPEMPGADLETTLDAVPALGM
ncbi:recombinase family protein [Methylorubrum aminovorans]